MTAIEVEGVRKTYGGGVEALRGVSLSVQSGEVFGLLGANGAGKTTLVKILLDVVRPTAGRTSLLGVSSRKVAARRPVGYLPEDHRFPEYHTPRSAMAFYGGLSGRGRAWSRRRGDELLAEVGLEEAADRKIRSFSKGMKQRLGLAVALVAEPQLLLLDEPTDGVDPLGRVQIRELLEREKKAGRTVFVNSHLLSEVEQVCDRVAILAHGAVVRTGTIGELTKAELVYTVTTLAPLLDVQLAELASKVRSARRLASGVGVEVALDRDDEVDAVVDLLRSRGVSIRGLAGKRHSLEEVFLATVDEGAGA
jgi:ABC-2 type transport system ATP-binding protein